MFKKTVFDFLLFYFSIHKIDFVLFLCIVLKFVFIDINILRPSFVDVDDVKYVINFDYPNSSEDYIHRIGRTGRSSQSGTACTFFTSGNSKQARDLVSVLKEANQEICPKLDAMALRSGGGANRCKLLKHNLESRFKSQKYLRYLKYIQIVLGFKVNYCHKLEIASVLELYLKICDKQDRVFIMYGGIGWNPIEL